MSRLRSLAAFAFVACMGTLALASPAGAVEVRLPKPHIGAFTEAKGLAVDQGTHDVYAIDGRSEEQQIKVSATAGQFRLKFGALETGDLSFNANRLEVRDALRALVCPGKECIAVPNGQGNATGSNPYEVVFVEILGTTDVEQLTCLSGTTLLSGGSGCSVTTTTSGVNGSISRYQANGAPSSFSALGTNAIDGKGPGPDATPQEGLHFDSPRLVQIAVDNSGGATDGEIYSTHFSDHLVDVFAPSGEFKGQLTEYKEGAVFKPLQNVCGVAVDGSGNVYVSDAATGIHKYDSAGSPVTNADSIANFSTVSSPCALAAGAGSTVGSLFATEFAGKVSKLDATTGELKYKFSEGNNTTVTVDPVNGHVLAAAGGEVREFDASGSSSATQVGSIAAGSEVRGLVVDGSTGKGGTLYVSRADVTHLDVYGPLVEVPLVETKGAPAVGTMATLNGTISADGGPAASCHFEYLTAATYGAQKKAAEEAGEPKSKGEVEEAAFAGAQSVPCEPAGPFNGATLSPVSGKAEGLLPETGYEFRIVGTNANGQIADAPQSFETLGKPLIEGGSASQVTANSALIFGAVNPRGVQTEAAVEYVSEVQFDESGYAEASISEAQEIGDGIGFAEFSQVLTGLKPDTTYHFRLTAANESGTATPGEDHTFTTFAVPTGLPDGRAWEQVTPAAKGGEPFPPAGSARTGQGGTCKACTPGFDKERFAMQATADGNAIAYEGNPFAAGIAAAANEYVARRGAGGWQTAYLSKAQYRDDFVSREGFKALSPDLSRAILMQSPALTPEAPANFANLYLQDEGKAALTTLITAEPPNRSSDAFRVYYAGANTGSEGVPAFSHVIFQANDSLTPEDPGIAPEAPTVGAEARNLYEWSGGQLHLVNVLPGNGEAAADAVIGSGLLLEAAGGAANFDFDHAISDDGSRIFWSALPSGQVYVRENAESTIQIPDPGKFITAASDGSRVLLSNGHVYGLEDESTTDLTEGQGGFQGILGASEDLSRVYFVDSQALSPPEEENANGEHAEAGKPNLYLSDEGSLSFIGALLPSDDLAGDSNELGTWHAAAGNRLAQVSADGRYLAFESRASLSDYDNSTDFASAFEVFEYDAQEGTLSCASCNPSGAAPLGSSNLSLIFGRSDFFSDQPDNLPDQGEGRLFFESQDVLSAADTNGHIQDVYEWQPEGVGGCGRASGCITLISDGHSPKDSYFLDSTPSGNDAFFITRAALVPQDIDDFLDVYDARVGGGIPEVLNPPCEGEACKGAALGAPEEKSPASAFFSAPGNQRQRSCARGRVRRGARCVKRAKRHHGKRSKRSADKHGRGGRG